MFYLYYLLIENKEDRIKFDKIANKYQNMMYSVAYKVVNDKTYAEEALQSALVALARNIGHIETDNEVMLKSYLYTTAENAGIDAWRRKKRSERVLSIYDYADTAGDDDVFENVAGSEYTKRLVKLLDKMPAHYREVLVLSLLHEHSLYQVADELDRKYVTVRKQFERGKKILKELMKEAGTND